MGKRTIPHPRPALHVPPRGIGPIVKPNKNDVLCGRGGRINGHEGNIQFRNIINDRKAEYLVPTTKKLEKAHIAAAIVNEIRGMNPPGRFLKQESKTGLWFDVGDQKAIKKTGQALREDAPDIRPELGKNNPDDEKHSNGMTYPNDVLRIVLEGIARQHEEKKRNGTPYENVENKRRRLHPNRPTLL